MRHQPQTALFCTISARTLFVEEPWGDLCGTTLGLIVEFVRNELSCGKGFISCYLEKGLSRECFNVRHKSNPQILGERGVKILCRLACCWTVVGGVLGVTQALVSTSSHPPEVLPNGLWLWFHKEIHLRLKPQSSATLPI